jgi:hypothetical protein
MPDLLISCPDAEIADLIRSIAARLGCTVREPPSESAEPSALALAQALAPGLAWEADDARVAAAPLLHGRVWAGPSVREITRAHEARRLLYLTVVLGVGRYVWLNGYSIPADDAEMIRIGRACLVVRLRQYLRSPQGGYKAQRRHEDARALLAGLGEGA